MIDQPRRQYVKGKNNGYFKHGWHGTSTYQAWNGMINRCTYPKSRSFKYYGGRGIDVCDPWRASFTNFLRDMGPRPNGMELDRIDCNGNYEPSNCRWTTEKEQIRNRRCTIWIEHNGEKVALSDVCESLNLNRHQIYKRLKRGWTVEESLTIPFKGRERKCKFWVENRVHHLGYKPELGVSQHRA